MIMDSGDRTQFESGAVRDMRVGKGRCDLLPLDVVAEILNGNPIIFALSNFVDSDSNNIRGDETYLYSTLFEFARMNDVDISTMILEVAIHFEEGAAKYGDNNWRKGIPVRCYIDSAIRHYLKFLRGDTDERHDRAFCWNIMCAIWTCDHKPELNEYCLNPDKED